MRFSAAFTLPLPLVRSARPAEDVRPAERAAQLPPAQPAAPTPADLPEELDARVRMVGEWQLGEG